MNTQQHLTFHLGITNVPSDATCDDNALQECTGLVYEDGEHRPLQEPKKIMTIESGNMLFIHNPNSNTENYIVLNGTSLIWGVNNNGTFAADPTPLMSGVTDSGLQVMAIGKTLIVNMTGSVAYFTWKGAGTGYAQLDTNLPELDIDFRLTDFAARHGNEPEDPPRISTFDCLKVVGLITTPEYDYDEGRTGKKGYNNAVYGLYSEVRNKLRKKKYFVGPFFVRAAIKMYDNSFVKMTPPILMVPTMGNNSKSIWDYDYNDDSELYMSIYSAKLQYKLNNTNLSDYSDLISDVVLFATSEIETIDRDADAIRPSSQHTDIVSIYAATNDNKRLRYVQNLASHCESEADMSQISEETWYDINVMTPRSAADINKDLEESGIFYKLADIGTAQSSGWQDASDKIRDNVMENLTTQDRLTDEYFGHSRVSGKYAFVYNARLNLANVTRTLFEGFAKMVPYDYVDGGALYSYAYDIFVDVDAVDGNITVKKSILSSSERLGMWFYYPDARAKHVKILRNGELIVDEDLKEHKSLNGAYYFNGLPLDADYAPTGTAVDEPAYTSNPVEELSNSILTSEANNPYVFNAAGDNQAGDGTVLAIVPNTKALSQGQFGEHPLICFTTKGIWALITNDEGVFVASKPLPREVCNNPHSITQTDDAIIFSSEQGLMVLSGADVKCLSEQLKGDLQQFLRTAKIAYDYRDGLLWIVGTGADCYVYSMKSGTFQKSSHFIKHDGEGQKTISVINHYPDNLIQSNTSVYSLAEKPIEKEDTTTYTAKIVSRPIKFDSAMVLKSIMRMKLVKQLNANGTVRLSMEGSNDLSQWRQLTTLRSTPWKYYRITLNFAALKATDRFAGIVAMIQERRTNKLR